MIQTWLTEHLRPLHTRFEWTVDFEAKAEDAATVYYEGGGTPSAADQLYRYPRYMIWLESPDWELAEYTAQEIFDQLKGIRGVPITVIYRDKSGNELGRDHVLLHRLFPQGEPNRMGVEDGKMIYSINFDATISTQKEETLNG